MGSGDKIWVGHRQLTYMVSFKGSFFPVPILSLPVAWAVSKLTMQLIVHCLPLGKQSKYLSA